MIIENSFGLLAPIHPHTHIITIDDYGNSLNSVPITKSSGNSNSFEIKKKSRFFRDNYHVAPNTKMAIETEKMLFINLNAGGWYGQKATFGLVCGKYVYLCAYCNVDKTKPMLKFTSIHDSVNKLFEILNNEQYYVAVSRWAYAPDPRIKDDDKIYIFIPDHHLPPLDWFLPWTTPLKTNSNNKRIIKVKDREGTIHEVAEFEPYSVHARSGNDLDWYENNKQNYWLDGIEVDIFANASAKLVNFLKLLSKVKNIEVIQLGDMFELWLNREYQFKESKFKAGGQDKVIDWVNLVIQKNKEVIKAYKNLEKVTKVTFVYGNHDGYFRESSITTKTGVTPRIDKYTVQDYLYAAHGHQFDFLNRNYVPWYLGPEIANLNFKSRDVLRLLEPKTNPTLNESTLLFLRDKFNEENKMSYSIFVFGHTHIEELQYVSLEVSLPDDNELFLDYYLTDDYFLGT